VSLLVGEDKSDHDLLIEISTKITLFTDRFDAHDKRDEREFAVLGKDVKAAHRRMDFMMLVGILAIVGFIVSLWTA